AGDGFERPGALGKADRDLPGCRSGREGAGGGGRRGAEQSRGYGVVPCDMGGVLGGYAARGESCGRRPRCRVPPAGGSHGASGSSITKRAPPPGASSTLIEPPWSFVCWAASARPRPVPFGIDGSCSARP